MLVLVVPEVATNPFVPVPAFVIVNVGTGVWPLDFPSETFELVLVRQPTTVVRSGLGLGALAVCVVTPIAKIQRIVISVVNGSIRLM